MTNIVVPQLGESIVEARVARWLKKEGDSVEVGEPLVELETEKIDLEVNAERGGVVASIKHREGDDVRIGEVLGVIDENRVVAKTGGNGAATAPAPTRSSSGTASPATPATPAADAPAGAMPTEAPAPAEDRRATPTARRMARDHDVNLGAVKGSGTAGR